MITFPGSLPTGGEVAEIVTDAGTYDVRQREDGDWDIVGRHAGMPYAATVGFDGDAFRIQVHKPMKSNAIATDGDWRELLRLSL